MMSVETFLWGWLVFALALLPVQFFIVAPYGRHVSLRWGPLLDNTVAWIVMEAVALIAFWWGLFWHAGLAGIAWWPVLLFSAHYLHRAFIYPLRARVPGKRMPILIMLFAVTFNTVNGGANGLYVGQGLVAEMGWWTVIGSVLFVAGMAVNVAADYQLIRLKCSGGYRIPRGRLFRLISCPNHAGEMIQWGGFALVCWNLPALTFLVWTVANLLPRSVAHHQWYHENFDNYPQDRRALIPYVL